MELEWNDRKAECLVFLLFYASLGTCGGYLNYEDHFLKFREKIRVRVLVWLLLFLEWGTAMTMR
jgi:hypothetical protein